MYMCVVIVQDISKFLYYSLYIIVSAIISTVHRYITDWHISASTTFSDMQGKQDPYELTLTAPT